MPEAFIAAAVRTAVGKAPRGALSSVRPDDLAAIALKAALAHVPQLDPAEVEDVILGCAMPEGEQGLNVARIAAMRAGLPASASAMTINRFCSSGLQAIALAADAIHAGRAQVALAGGTESMSMVPMEGNKFSANPWLVDHYPDVYLSMGLTAENVAAKYNITREQADEFALASHQKALAAIRNGKFQEEIVPVTAANGEIKIDEGPRPHTSGEDPRAGMAGGRAIVLDVEFVGLRGEHVPRLRIISLDGDKGDFFVLEPESGCDDDLRVGGWSG